MLRYYRSVDATITRSDTVRRVVARTRALDEDLLKGSSTVPYTAVVEELLDPRSNRTHGQVITAQRCSVPHFVRQFGLALRTCREHGGAVLIG